MSLTRNKNGIESYPRITSRHCGNLNEPTSILPA